MSKKTKTKTNTKAKSTKKKSNALDKGKIGALITSTKDDDIIFEVSEKKIETFGPITWNVNAQYASHNVHGGYAVPEWTGNSNDTMSFEVILSAYFGVNPIKELEKLKNICTKHVLCQFLLGNTPYGYWYVQSLGNEMKYIDKQGNIFWIKVQVKLLAEPNPEL